MSDKIQLYSLATPNGQKVSIALEEMGLSYEAHTINILKGEQFKPEFVDINPNSKIPALVDPVGDNGRPLAIMESGAILLHLAEKTGRFLPSEVGARSRALQWLFFQVGGVGPMFGQFGHFFKYAGDKCDHPYPMIRYSTETQRLLGVLDKQLGERAFLAGPDISIADFATAPWVHCLDHFYKGSEELGLKQFNHLNRWMSLILDRPGVQSGMKVCDF